MRQEPATHNDKHQVARDKPALCRLSMCSIFVLFHSLTITLTKQSFDSTVVLSADSSVQKERSLLVTPKSILYQGVYLIFFPIFSKKAFSMRGVYLILGGSNIYPPI